MGEEVIAAVVIGVLEKTIAVVADRIGLTPGFKDELKKMEGLVRDIQARVADAETKKSQSSIVSRWLKDFKGAIFEAEIVLDELQYEGLRREVHKFKRSSTVAKVCSFFSLSKHDVSFRMRMNSKVRGINEKLKGIKQKAEVLELEMLNRDLLRDLLLGRDTDVTVEGMNRKTDSFLEQFVAGRSREESEIVDMLLLVSSDDNNPSVSVLPIVGMGGLGKTTLAKLIYNNGIIVNHFTKRSWVCVSDKFDEMVIFKGILESLKEKGLNVDTSSRDAIVHEIQKEVGGERFLFVLDDVWTEDPRLWDNFFNSLAGLNSANGSCCLLTTRLQTTANFACTPSFNPFVLNKISNDDCWSIIGRKATKGEEMPEEFDIHKEEILQKCQGLPLAANAFGCLLNSQRKEDWVSVVEALKVQVAVDGDKDILPILKLSYDYLPHPRIKKCFACCSVYKKDAEMEGRELIELWMVEGYLQDDMQGRPTMEEDGARCLKLLVQSSLLEKKHSDYFDDLYQMHDRVHDLACFISNQEYHDGDICRNLVVHKGKDLSYFWNEKSWNEKSKLIQVVEGDVSDKMLSKHRHARVMNLSSREIKKLPNAIGNLKHIRCLNISLHKIESLPEPLCKLYNLQILRISGCRNLQCLPQGLSNLISLRHLYCGSAVFSTRFAELEMPPDMGRLSRLQTLEFFNVGEKNGREIKELGFMKNLKGSLKIRNLELVKGKEEATSANLVGKENIIELQLIWGSARGFGFESGIDWSYRGTGRTTRRKLEDEHVLEGLEPCSGLRRLAINDFMGVRFPKWLGKLSALEGLHLRDCKNITELGCSGDGGFPKLKTLYISGCWQLSSAPTSFPVLNKLEVTFIQASAVRDIISTTTNSLEDLRLDQVSGMNSLSDVIEPPFSSSLKDLEIRCCEDMIEMDGSFRTQLPQQLEHFSSLVKFTISKFDSLERLPGWLGKLTSLQELRLRDCFKLEHLPMDAMKNLQRLDIRKCSLLEETQGHEINALPNLEVRWRDY